MFGFAPKIAVSEEQRQWADYAFQHLGELLGVGRMLTADVILAQDRYFPDPYDGSRTAVVAMANRIAGYMGISASEFDITVYAEREKAWRESVPYWHETSRDAAGLYQQRSQEGCHHVGVHAEQLKEPGSLAATLVHELAHVLLLGRNLLDPKADDMEPLTEVATVFLGCGVLRANAIVHFRQWNEGGSHGWQFRRSGYLPEPLWGYALARFATERGEEKPEWANALADHVRPYYRQAARYLRSPQARR